MVDENHSLIPRKSPLHSGASRNEFNVYVGIMRLWMALSILWVLFWVIAGISIYVGNELHSMKDFFTIFFLTSSFPLVGFLVAKLLCWVIRGFSGHD